MNFIFFLFRALVIFTFIATSLSGLMDHRFVKRECVSNICVWSVEARP